MTTIDQILTKLVQHTEPTIDDVLTKRDARVLRSLHTATLSPAFITENQSRLLLKILQENSKKLEFLGEEFTLALSAPIWSRIFRQVDKTKRISIGKVNDDVPAIILEFPFSSSLRKNLGNLSKITDGPIIALSGRFHSCDLTEKNIVLLVEGLASEGFVMDEQITNHYKTIKSWSENDVRDQFLLTNIVHQNFQKAITNDLGIETRIDENIIADRSVRYQYHREKTEKNPENLTEMLAHRTETKVWVDNKKYSVDEIISSLIELKRFPIMFVFDGFNPNNQTAKLEEIAKTLDKHGIYDNVGLYFRLPNNDIGKTFNELIAKRKYNCQLDKNTKVVGVQSGKIPKFFLTNDWKPMSVVSLDVTLRHSKTAVYANCCDLIISHTETNPIIETKNLWQ